MPEFKVVVLWVESERDVGGGGEMTSFNNQLDIWYEEQWEIEDYAKDILYLGIRMVVIKPRI